MHLNNYIGFVLAGRSYLSSAWAADRKRFLFTTIKMTPQKQEIDQEAVQEWNSYNLADLSVGAAYKLGISAVVPRPVGVLTTVDPETGIVNCAPFSYTSLASHDPPIVTHGLCLSNGKKKDSLRNIEASQEWVCHVLTTHFLSESNECAASLPPDQSEIDANNLETLDCDLIKVPRLKLAPLAMECKLFDKKELFNDEGKHTTTIVMGRVVKYHIRSDVLAVDCDIKTSPIIDLHRLQAVGRAGGITYWPVGTPETPESDPEVKKYGGGGALDIIRPK